MGQVSVMRNGLRESAQELQKIRTQLLALQGAVPLPKPTDVDHDAEPDALSEMSAVIGCGLRDCLEPLIRDLLAAAEYQSKTFRRGQPLGEVDLHRADEATRQALYEMVRKDNFSPAPSADADAWNAPYTAEAAELKIFYLHGRWFATWVKLELPAEKAEAERRELLLLDESDEHPGVLLYREV